MVVLHPWGCCKCLVFRSLDGHREVDMEGWKLEDTAHHPVIFRMSLRTKDDLAQIIINTSTETLHIRLEPCYNNIIIYLT